MQEIFEELNQQLESIHKTSESLTALQGFVMGSIKGIADATGIPERVVHASFVTGFVEFYPNSMVEVKCKRKR